MVLQSVDLIYRKPIVFTIRFRAVSAASTGCTPKQQEDHVGDYRGSTRLFHKQENRVQKKTSWYKNLWKQTPLKTMLLHFCNAG